MLSAGKAFLKRHWPALSIRTLLFGTLLFVATLPGFAALFLRVYENTLVQQTEAELIAQGAVLASAYRSAWGAAPAPPAEPRPEAPGIDLRQDPVLPRAAEPTAGPAADLKAAAVGRRLAPIVADASGITLAATRILDTQGVTVVGRGDVGLSYAALPEVTQALAGRSATVLRERADNPYGAHSPLEWLSRGATIRVHHVRPVIAGGRVIGAVMLSRSPRALFIGIYQDRGKILIGIVLIFVILVLIAGVLSRGIAKPLRRLAAATENVARGPVTVPEPPATAAIEIRELYRNFAAMAERVEHRTRYLRDFAAAMSHEFKTPLTGIRGAIELLEEHGAAMGDAERRRFLANAAADADRLSRLVQRLLELARADLGAADGASCDPAAVATAVAARMSDAACAVMVVGTSGAARIGANVLDAVLAILLENARHAGAGHVIIDVSAEAITVSDDGPGIAAGDRARVFEPFFTADRAAGRTGLGLPIARSLLSASGATITLIDHAPGARFAIAPAS